MTGRLERTEDHNRSPPADIACRKTLDCDGSATDVLSLVPLLEYCTSSTDLGATCSQARGPLPVSVSSNSKWQKWWFGVQYLSRGKPHHPNHDRFGFRTEYGHRQLVYEGIEIAMSLTIAARPKRRLHHCADLPGHEFHAAKAQFLAFRQFA